jgi:D-sorbitol dehydrogenase (acceptor)
MGKLDGKVAIVTGAGSGIGKAVAGRYAAEGARVVAADRDAAAAEQTATDIGAASGEAMAVAVDVTDREAVEAMVGAAVGRFGGVDVLFNGAGVFRLGRLLEITEADWDFNVDVNCKGTLWCAQAVARRMIAQGRGGKIVNVASQAGRRGEAHVLAYCASKAAVISMTQSMALALAPHRINVNAIAPGVVDTPMWQVVDRQFAEAEGIPVGAAKARAEGAVPLGRFGTPAEMTGAAVFLASADADYVTQQTLNVDGGNWPN